MLKFNNIIIYIDANDFYYNLFENIINTNEKLNYKVIEKETKNTIEQFRKLFDSDIDIIEGKYKKKKMHIKLK